MSKGQLFRRLLAEKPFIVTPGITNALHALIVSLAAMRTGMKAFWDYAVDLGERGAAAEMEFEKVLAGHAMSTFHDFAGFAKIRELEQKYLPADEFNMRYEKSQGR